MAVSWFYLMEELGTLQMIKILYAFVLALAAWPVVAGIPVEETVECPWEFGRAKITSTLSCSSRGGEVYLDGSQPSSCEFVTVLPVCSKHALPLYTKFKKGDEKLLRTIVKREEYQALLQRTRFERAFFVDQSLQRLRKGDRFFLLLSGYHSEPQRTYGDADYGALFRQAYNDYLPEMEAEDKPWLVAAAAYVQLRLGKVDKARKLLQWVRRNPGKQGKYVLRYVAAVERCLTRTQDKSCAPKTVLQLDRD